MSAVAFLAVYREGFETILFYKALFTSAGSAGVPVVLGIAVGAVGLVAIYLLINQLGLRESEEMRDDRMYLERVLAELRAEGLDADAVLAAGDPTREIADAAERERCDLIAMATHGHRLVADLLRGSVASEVRHVTMVPVLLVRMPKPAKEGA